jgi:hypothetical protein
MRVGLNRSTSNAQVEGQSCGQVLWKISGLLFATASKGMNMSGPLLAARSKIPRVPRLYPPWLRNSRGVAAIFKDVS